MRSLDGSVAVSAVGDEVESLSESSCFRTVAEASAFFEAGSLGYSAARDQNRLDGLRLLTVEWRVRALAITNVHSSYFEDLQTFPKGSVEFDHLVMRNIKHEWQSAQHLYI